MGVLTTVFAVHKLYTICTLGFIIESDVGFVSSILNYTPYLYSNMYYYKCIMSCDVAVDVNILVLRGLRFVNVLTVWNIS